METEVSSKDIFAALGKFGGSAPVSICRLHSACRPDKRKLFMCGNESSRYPVLDFDKIKEKLDDSHRRSYRQSVDGVTVTDSDKDFYFIELKSWELVLKYHGTEAEVREQGAKYESALPDKLASSMEICGEIMNDPTVLDSKKIVYVLLTDISVDDGLEAFVTDMMALSGISSDLKKLCNVLSRGVMDGIVGVETRYWECRDFDRKMELMN